MSHNCLSLSLLEVVNKFYINFLYKDDIAKLKTTVYGGYRNTKNIERLMWEEVVMSFPHESDKKQ